MLVLSRTLCAESEFSNEVSPASFAGTSLYSDSIIERFRILDCEGPEQSLTRVTALGSCAQSHGWLDFDLGIMIARKRGSGAEGKTLASHSSSRGFDPSSPHSPS